MDENSHKLSADLSRIHANLNVCTSDQKVWPLTYSPFTQIINITVDRVLIQESLRLRKKIEPCIQSQILYQGRTAAFFFFS